MSESNICRIVHKIENILIKSRQFRLPGKKELWQSSSEEELVVMDVMESPIERPKKGQKPFYSGKQKEHTLKTQLVIKQQSGQIVCLVNGKGRTHDFQLFKDSGVKFVHFFEFWLMCDRLLLLDSKKGIIVPSASSQI